MGQFVLDISRFVEKQKLDANDVVRGSLYQLFSRIIDKTPVDTGRAKGNWIATIGEPSNAKTGVLDPKGEKSKDRVAVALGKFDIYRDKKLFFSNTLPYIVMLEFGWSQQSPIGMVRLALQTYNGMRFDRS